MSQGLKETAGHETVVSTPNDTQIVMTRTFDFPRDLVWRLWNDPACLPEFWGPRSTTTRVDTYDLREGGKWRLINVDGEGTEHAFRGEFRKVSPRDLIEWTFEYEPMAGNVIVESLRFEERDGRTTIISTSTFDTEEQRDGMLGSGMEKGAGETHDRFEELLARAGEFTVTGVDFVLLPTQDLDRATEFYTGVLGLQRSSVWQRGSDPAIGAEFETGTVTIALIDSEAVGVTFQPHKQAIALRVDDVQSARAKLESRGISFAMDTIDSGVCHQAVFADPDGNALILHHRYAPRSSSN